MPDPISDAGVQLAFSVHESKGVFALLVGSGLSRAAGIPTGWEITLDLIRRIGLAQNVKEQTDWAKWYRKKVRQEPNYSSLLEELASSREERRSILHSYIEPTKEEREEGRKVPTAAHFAIADLVASGYVRVIITTNFDRLLENALRERGIEPTIVASVDALAGAEPLAHSTCYVLKLHGDYKDARILNTDAELTAYPPQYNVLLDRIFDEHGLVICGWSGEWDHALRAALLRAPNRRYPVYWAARGTIAAGAQELIDHRRARVIPITDADGFFKELRERVETLSQSKRQNPLTTDLLVRTAKRYLAKPELRIQLHDLIEQEADRTIARLAAADSTAQAQWDPAIFRARVRHYESMTEPLARVAGALGRWGDDSELSMVLDLIRVLYKQSEKQGAGVTFYVNIRSYPAVLVFTTYALGLTRAERWKALHQVLSALIDQQYRKPVRIVDCLFLNAWHGTEHDAWKQIEGLERLKTPLSDYLCELLAIWGTSFVALTHDFELIFERFELLGALAHLENYTKADLQQALTGDPMQAWNWFPLGRIGWHNANRDKLIVEIESDVMKAELLKARFAGNDPEFYDLSVTNFRRMASRVSWR